MVISKDWKVMSLSLYHLYKLSYRMWQLSLSVLTAMLSFIFRWVDLSSSLFSHSWYRDIFRYILLSLCLRLGLFAQLSFMHLNMCVISLPFLFWWLLEFCFHHQWEILLISHRLWSVHTHWVVAILLPTKACLLLEVSHYIYISVCIFIIEMKSHSINTSLSVPFYSQLVIWLVLELFANHVALNSIKDL